MIRKIHITSLTDNAHLLLWLCYVCIVVRSFQEAAVVPWFFADTAAARA